MIRTKKRFKTYNDGYLTVCRLKAKESSFGAFSNPKKQSDLIHVCRLAYEEMSRRDSDMEFAESDNHKLSMKVRTPYLDRVHEKHNVVIGNMLYSIFKLDYDRSKREMYLYLEEVRNIE